MKIVRLKFFKLGIIIKLKGILIDIGARCANKTYIMGEEEEIKRMEKIMDDIDGIHPIEEEIDEEEEEKKEEK